MKGRVCDLNLGRSGRSSYGEAGRGMRSCCPTTTQILRPPGDWLQVERAAGSRPIVQSWGLLNYSGCDVTFLTRKIKIYSSPVDVQSCRGHRWIAIFLRNTSGGEIVFYYIWDTLEKPPDYQKPPYERPQNRRRSLNFTMNWTVMLCCNELIHEY